ncbi:hypothetical protein F5Y16DRAFT_356258 [Xylariaceae sp. FL0255]|nr:hypothetical protein F5Y16DRAFT_356258 [Xylariaceae sp. FL0255]
MPAHKAHLRTSRRIPPLQDHEIDHEISLVNHENSSKNPKPGPLSVVASQNSNLSPTDYPLAASESQVPLTEDAAEAGKSSVEQELGTADIGSSSGQDLNGQIHEVTEPTSDGIDEETEIQNAKRRSKQLGLDSRRSRSQPRRIKEVETAIDILYENQRGGFLCGIPLFSSAALGNLDPTPWTNFAHKTSPTDIHTAQVPDPSWEWAWPEWQVNHDEEVQMDDDGWEYSFMFSQKFSWHGPKWYNSYVRRRAWIRRRIRKDNGYQPLNDQMGNSEYFTVVAKEQRTTTLDETGRPSLDRQSRRSYDSRRSRERSRSEDNAMPTVPEVRTTADLMAALKRSRIDREKLEAVEEYIANSADDLAQLEDHMHDIMAAFVFQASRKLLLARLTQVHDNVADKSQKAKKVTIPKAQHLAAAVVHADEEVRRLEYWSDIRGMAEDGEAPIAVDESKGWDSSWQGLDNSGAKGIKDTEQLPGGGP